VKHFFARDVRRRKLFFKYELDRIFLKSVYCNCLIEGAIRERARLALMRLPKNSSRVRLRNRCTVTYRSGGIVSYFKISRMVFRELASRGFLYGIRKSGKS
jgi:small subunit ribosomal protein S14